jgi:nucleoside-diphosphate-sugar epimerase
LYKWCLTQLRPDAEALRGDISSSHGAAAGPISSVELLRGDIAKPWFGLDEAAWSEIRARVSTVIHCAATIRLGGDWDDHVDANVRGTAEVVAFADGKALHHVSTLSVFVSTDRARGRHVASDNPQLDAIAWGGYAQTKIAAEAIARDAGATIYRLGLLVDEARSDDQRAMTMRGLATLGSVPAGCREWCHDVTPVEYAAKVIVDGVLGGASGCRHVSGGGRVTVAQIVERLGLDEIPMAVWCERARARIADADVAMALGAFSARRDIGLFLATGVEW